MKTWVTGDTRLRDRYTDDDSHQQLAALAVRQLGSVDKYGTYRSFQPLQASRREFTLLCDPLSVRRFWFSQFSYQLTELRCNEQCSNFRIAAIDPLLYLSRHL